MSLTLPDGRAFDDSRWENFDGLSDCFLCGLKVEQTDPNRGEYDEPPAGPRLKIHLPCLNDRTKFSVHFHYRRALDDMAMRQLKRLLG